MNSIFFISLGIFIATFFFIVTEKIHRTVIAFFGAILMIVAGILLDFYHPVEALAAIDFNTIGLLFGMMTIVAILEKTGFFQYLAIWTAKKTKGNPWLLFVSLSALTTVLSMILDNVTTVILIAPVTIIIARVLEINPVPILMAEAILSNVGGVGTLVGDPPNIIIGSAANFSFNDFLVHTLPVVVVAWFVSLFIMRFTFRKTFKEKTAHLDKLEDMNENEAIEDPKDLKKILGILGFVIILFFFHHSFHMPPAIVALIGAALTLILVAPKHDPQGTLEKIELSVLLFFASLFVIVGGLEHAHVLEHFAKIITQYAESNMLLTAILILWTTAIISAIVDNIPMTVAMIPIILHLQQQGIEVELLWWSLALGVGFGGNGSPIGASANIIVVAKSEQIGKPISFIRWIKDGAPVMFASLSVATIAIILFTPYFS